jgi:triosephosphate isomerase
MGNWKMNKDLSSAVSYVEEFFKLARDTGGKIDIVLFPPFPLIHPVVEAIRGGARWTDLFAVGAQDMHFAEKGAYTGAVSGICIKSVGATHVIIGHSERRTLFGDDNKTVGAKLKSALEMGLVPVLCVGEPLDIRDAGREEEYVIRQLKSAFDKIETRSLRSFTFAYEPIWAIGTGRNATRDEIEPMHNLIRKWASKVGFQGGGDSVRILYGGSVNPDNARELYDIDGVDGFLVGGASLEAYSFAAILDAMIGKE